MKEEIRDMIEPIPNWKYTYCYESPRTYGKSYMQELLDEKDKEIEKLQNILDNIGYQIEGIIRTTEEFGISKNTGEVLSKHNIELLKEILKMIVNKDVSIGSDKE